MPKEYVSKKYQDFNETNVVWCFDIEDGKFKAITLNNVIAGDTDSCMLRVSDALSDYSVDEIVEVADDVVRHTDARFPEFLKIAFNCPPDRLRSVRTDREVVSDKSFFVTKKRYAMHIVDDEGKRVDKMKIMGLEVKKSDTSAAVRECLSTIIQMVVDGCDRTELVEHKSRFKREFYTKGIEEIGVPMPSTKITQYMGEYTATGSMKGFPYHYRAAIFYNTQCGPSDRQIYAGEKFYVCNIKDTRSKYIAQPLISNKCPEFMEGIEIDYDAMWMKVSKKIDNYLKSMGWDIQSRMETQAQSMFGVG